MRELLISEDSQGIDWERLKDRTECRVILRAGYGTGSADGLFRRYAKSCEELRIPFGVYWHSYAFDPQMGRQEAECCVSAVEEYEIAFPIGIRYDEASIRYARSRGIRVTQELISKIEAAFCRQIRQSGYKAAMYSRAHQEGCLLQALSTPGVCLTRK